MSNKAKKIARLVDKALGSGIAGRTLVEGVHEILWSYASRNDEIETTGEDCPENNPDHCDSP